MKNICFYGFDINEKLWDTYTDLFYSIGMDSNILNKDLSFIRELSDIKDLLRKTK